MNKQGKKVIFKLLQVSAHSPMETPVLPTGCRYSS